VKGRNESRALLLYAPFLRVPSLGIVERLPNKRYWFSFVKRDVQMRLGP
jgi:hypothetical protein